MSQTIHAADDSPHEPHAMPLRVLFGVFVILLLLTFATVAVTWVDLGGLNVWVALIVAVVKAAFVGLYFMHLRYDNPFNGLILVFSLAFVALFIGFALIDSIEYQPAFDEPAIVELGNAGG